MYTLLECRKCDSKLVCSLVSRPYSIGGLTQVVWAWHMHIFNTCIVGTCVHSDIDGENLGPLGYGMTLSMSILRRLALYCTDARLSR